MIEKVLGLIKIVNHQHLQSMHLELFCCDHLIVQRGIKFYIPWDLSRTFIQFNFLSKFDFTPTKATNSLEKIIKHHNRVNFILAAIVYCMNRNYCPSKFKLMKTDKDQ